MDIANANGGMVIGTGDMSELALGWATYNGDHMSMYGVNASVPKTLVRHLVQYYADTTDDKELQEVLYDVLDTPVSPELLPPKDGKIAQKTEDLVVCSMVSGTPESLIFSFMSCFLRLQSQKFFRIPAEFLRMHHHQLRMSHLGDAVNTRLGEIPLDEPDIPPAILLFVVAVPVGDFRTDFSGALRKRIVVGRPECIADRPIGKGFEIGFHGVVLLFGVVPCGGEPFRRKRTMGVDLSDR